MAKKIKLTAVIILTALIAVFVFAPLIIDSSAYADDDTRERNWDSLTRGGELRDSATISDYAVIMDAHTGEVLYQENANYKRFPASITKIMTCLVVLENANLSDTVTISSLNVNEENAKKIGLISGEVISLEDLLYGFMLESGNDAGVALAQHVSGSVEAFAELMNEKAAELGMVNSHFVNPHGLHDSNHYTTAMDMARLAYAAMQNPTFRKIVSTYYYTPPTTNKHTTDNPWYPKTWENSNRLISTASKETYRFNGDYGRAIGIKTGYTGAAESTLVAAAVSPDGTQEVITVVLYDTQIGKWTDSITMFMYAFEFYDTLDVGDFLTADVSIFEHVENAADETVEDNLEMYVVPDGKAYITDKTAIIQSIKNQPERFTKVENYTRELIAPIEKDEEIGTIEYYLDGGSEPILTCTLIAANEVAAKPTATPVPTATPAKQADETPEPVASGEVGTLGYVGYGLVGFVGLALIILIVVSLGRRAKYHQYHVSARGKHSATGYNDGIQKGKHRKK